MSQAGDVLKLLLMTITLLCTRRRPLPFPDAANPAFCRSAIKFSQNGKYLLLSSLDDVIRLWSLATGKCVKSYVGHANRKYCTGPSFLNLPKKPESITAPTNGSTEIPSLEVHVLMGSEDGRLIIWNLNGRNTVLDHRIDIPAGVSVDSGEKCMISVTLHPNQGNLAAAIGQDILLYKLVLLE